MDIKCIPICPFVGKPCIGDGFTKQTLKEAVFFPCAFFDAEYQSGVESCKILRAVNRINKEEDCPDYSAVPEVPFDYSRKEGK